MGDAMKNALLKQYDLTIPLCYRTIFISVGRVRQGEAHIL